MFVKRNGIDRFVLCKGSSCGNVGIDCSKQKLLTRDIFLRAKVKYNKEIIHWFFKLLGVFLPHKNNLGLYLTIEIFRPHSNLVMFNGID